MIRMFKEADVFASSNFQMDSCKVILHSSAQGAVRTIFAPQYIENPYSNDFYDLHMKPYQSPVAEDFCLEIPEAVLYGERAVVTRDNLLVTDLRCSPPGRLNFHPEARRFEVMLPTLELDGYLTSERVDKPDVEFHGTACLLSSWEHWNYGAVLLRELPKILDLRRLGLTNLPVISPASPWHRQLLNLFGIQNIIDHDRSKSYMFNKLIVPSQKSNNFNFDSDVVNFFQDAADGVAGDTPCDNSAMIYVSRVSQGKKNKNYRRCVNEEALVDELLKLGFRIVEPESYSVKEQIAIFRSARFVVGPSGAGMFNTVFCRPGTEVMSIEPLPNWFWQHRNMFSSMNHSYGFITGGVVADDPSPTQKSWVADIPTILKSAKKVMNKIGF